MAYSARSDIEARYGVGNVDRWADLDSDANAGNITARITKAIVSADAMVDDALRGGVYTIPFTTVPENILGASADLAAHWLYTSRPRSDTQTTDGSSKGFDKTFKDVMAWLKKVKRGAVRLNLAHTEVAPLVIKGAASV